MNSPLPPARIGFLQTGQNNGWDLPTGPLPYTEASGSAVAAARMSDRAASSVA